MATEGTRPDVVAAGLVVVRKGRVLLVHRPRYDDWSFPKGKLDRGESVLAAAVREVEEETGLRARARLPLTAQRYRVSRTRDKVVHYWTGQVVGDPDISGYVPNAEIDEVAWVPLEEAQKRLTYPYDRDTLAEALGVRSGTRSLIVLRHAKARARKTWRGQDRLRPLISQGAGEAMHLAPILAAYDPERVVTSPGLRCVQTVAPYVALSARDVDVRDCLSEEAQDPAAVGALALELVAAGERAVLCTHRPVLPSVFAALGLEPVKLDPAELLVIHHRRGEIVAVERHRP